MVDEPSSLGEAAMLGAGSIEHRELIYYTVSKSTTFEPEPPRGGASEGDSKCYVLTRFDAFVLIVTDIGRPTHGHTDGYDGLGLGLNRYVKICMCYRSNSVYTRPGSAYIYAFIYKAQA